MPKSAASWTLRRFAIALLNYANAFDALDAQLLPSVFRALEASLGLAPTDLASLALAQSLPQALLTPLWGRWADTRSRGAPRPCWSGSPARCRR